MSRNLRIALAGFAALCLNPAFAKVEVEAAQQKNLGNILIVKVSEDIAPGDYDAMLKALLASCNGLQVSALMLTRYLSNHFHYWAGGEMGHARYPRGLIRVVLSQALRHVGVRFPAPPEPDKDVDQTPGFPASLQRTDA